MESTTTTSSAPTAQAAPSDTSSTTAAAGSSTSTTMPSTSSSAVVPSFESGVSEVTAETLFASWHPGCPVSPQELRLVTVSHWGFNGEVLSGELVVAAELADDVVDIFEDLFEARYPIERIERVDVYDGDDDRSMAANNTSAFNCRPVTGGTEFSEHSYGRAIDINPLLNPYVSGGLVLPPEGIAWVDRTLGIPGMITDGDVVVTAFASRGWVWGGTWTSLQDYQHFSTTGR